MGALEASSLVNKVESRDIITSSDFFLNTEENSSRHSFFIFDSHSLPGDLILCTLA